MVNKFPLDSSFLHGKSILLTGGTGFVGKCILELILRDHYVHIEKVYLLIREKKGKSIKQRIVDEILSNKLFNVLKDHLSIKQFYHLILPKLIPIQGDISLPGLGIQDNDLEMLKNDLNIIIHCAATVDFNERLDRSLKLNTLGTLQLVEIADQCHNFDGFVHVSTAYVNSNRKEKEIYERIYPMIFGDVKELVEQIQNMDLEQIKQFTDKILTCYPNTYTFTKSLAENMILIKAEEMKQREIANGRKAFNLAIVRPTVVTSTAYDPVPGWVDGVAAANAIAMYIGLGILDSTPGPRDSVLDLVPVDYLAKIVLKACYEFNSKPGTEFNISYADKTRQIKDLDSKIKIDTEEVVYPKIYHASSSGLNPITWLDFGNYVVNSWLKLPALKKRLFTPTFHKYSNDMEHDAMLLIKQNYKFKALSMINTVKDKQKAENLKKAKPKLDFLYHCFKHFMINTWYFQNFSLLQLQKNQKNQLNSILSRDISTDDIINLNWKDYIMNFCYGMSYFVLNEDPTLRKDYLIEGWEDIKYLNNNNSSDDKEDLDLIFDNNNLTLYDKSSLVNLRSKVIHDSAVVNYLKQNYTEDSKKYQNRILKELLVIENSIEPEKLINNITSFLKYQTILINKNNIVKLKQMIYSYNNQNNQNSVKVIYLPNHTSSLDFNLLTYICYYYNLPLPILSIEQSYKLLYYKVKQGIIYNKLLFKQFNNDEQLVQLLIQTYLVKLLNDNNNSTNNSNSICLFLNDLIYSSNEQIKDYTKLLEDMVDLKQYDDLFNDIINNEQLNNQNILLVPISINYEMYYDNNYLINELYNNINNNNLNDENKAIFRNNDKNSNISNKETNNNSNSIQLFKDQKNSKIMVTIGNPIERNNLKMKIEQLKMMDNNDLSLTHSSYMIQSWQCQNQLISPINLISLVLLSYRNNKDGISSNKIQNYLILFKKELFNLGFNLDFNENEDSSAVLNYALNLIGEQRLTIKLGEEDNEDNEEVDGLLNYKVNRVYLNDDIDSILYLNLLTKPIIPIFLFESIFILSYYYTHKKYSSQPEYQGFITKQQVEIEFSKIIKLILNLYPEIIIYLKQYTIEMLFNKFIKCNYIQLLDQFIIMNISPNTMDYFHILLTLLHSKLDTFWIVLAGLSSLKQDQSMSYDQFYTMIQHVIYNGIHNNYLHYKESISKEFIHLAIKNCESLKLIEIKDKHINILNANNQFENQLIEITAFVEKLCNLTNQRHQLPKPKVKLDIINENGTIAEDVINPTIAVIDNSILSQNLIKLFQSNISKVLHSTTNNNNFQSWFNWSNYFNPFDTNAFPSPISRKNSIS